MAYTVVLISIFILNAMSKRLSSKNRIAFFSISCFVILGLLSGVRYENEYSDFWVNYRRVIEVNHMSWGEVFHYSSEFLHQIFRKFIAIVFKDPQWYFILSSLFITGMFIRCAIKHTKDIFLFILLYYTVFAYFSANNITRQCIAVAMSLLAWKYLLNRKITKFSFVILVAVFIHTSAVFFFPLYFLSFKKFTRNTLYGYLIAGIIISVFNRPIISFFQRFLYSDYVEGSYGTTSSNPLRIVLAIIALFFMILYVSKEDNDSIKTNENADYNVRYKNFILHGTFMYVMCYVLSTIRMLMFARIALYFAPCAILCIIHGIENQKNKNNYILYRTGIILFAVLWFSVMNYAGKLIPTPYTPFWEYPFRIVL